MEEKEFGSWPAAVDRDSMVIICGEGLIARRKGYLGLRAARRLMRCQAKAIACLSLVCMRHHPQGVLLRPG